MTSINQTRSFRESIYGEKIKICINRLYNFDVYISIDSNVNDYVSPYIGFRPTRVSLISIKTLFVQQSYYSRISVCIFQIHPR